jgi:hypothetical protein
MSRAMIDSTDDLAVVFWLCFGIDFRSGLRAGGRAGVGAMWRKCLRVLAAAILASTAASASAQTLADGVPVFRSGGWVVLRTIDPMTDKRSCTGILNGDYDIQLSQSALYVRMRGGVTSVTLRFDDQPPEKLRLSSDFERRGRVALLPEELRKALGSSRIRIQVMTGRDGLELKDLDVTGIRDAHTNIRSGCSGNPLPDADVRRPSTEGSLCSTLVETRMRQRGLAASDIRAICAQ